MIKPSIPFDGLIPDYPSDTLGERAALDDWRHKQATLIVKDRHPQNWPRDGQIYCEYRRLVRENTTPTTESE